MVGLCALCLILVMGVVPNTVLTWTQDLFHSKNHLNYPCLKLFVFVRGSHFIPNIVLSKLREPCFCTVIYAINGKIGFVYIFHWIITQCILLESWSHTNDGKDEHVIYPFLERFCPEFLQIRTVCDDFRHFLACFMLSDRYYWVDSLVG